MAFDFLDELLGNKPNTSVFDPTYRPIDRAVAPNRDYIPAPQFDRTRLEPTPVFRPTFGTYKPAIFTGAGSGSGITPASSGAIFPERVSTDQVGGLSKFFEEVTQFGRGIETFVSPLKLIGDNAIGKGFAAAGESGVGQASQWLVNALITEPLQAIGRLTFGGELTDQRNRGKNIFDSPDPLAQLRENFELNKQTLADIAEVVMLIPIFKGAKALKLFESGGAQFFSAAGKNLMTGDAGKALLKGDLAGWLMAPVKSESSKVLTGEAARQWGAVTGRIALGASAVGYAEAKVIDALAPDSWASKEFAHNQFVPDGNPMRVPLDLIESLPLDIFGLAGLGKQAMQTASMGRKILGAAGTVVDDVFKPAMWKAAASNIPGVMPALDWMNKKSMRDAAEWSLMQDMNALTLATATKLRLLPEEGASLTTRIAKGPKPPTVATAGVAPEVGGSDALVSDAWRAINRRATTSGRVGPAAYHGGLPIWPVGKKLTPVEKKIEDAYHAGRITSRKDVEEVVRGSEDPTSWDPLSGVSRRSRKNTGFDLPDEPRKPMTPKELAAFEKKQAAFRKKNAHLFAAAEAEGMTQAEKFTAKNKDATVSKGYHAGMLKTGYPRGFIFPDGSIADIGSDTHFNALSKAVGKNIIDPKGGDPALWDYLKEHNMIHIQSHHGLFVPEGQTLTGSQIETLRDMETVHGPLKWDYGITSGNASKMIDTYKQGVGVDKLLQHIDARSLAMADNPFENAPSLLGVSPKVNVTGAIKNSYGKTFTVTSPNRTDVQVGTRLYNVKQTVDEFLTTARRGLGGQSAMLRDGTIVGNTGGHNAILIGAGIANDASAYETYVNHGMLRLVSYPEYSMVEHFGALDDITEAQQRAISDLREAGKAMGRSTDISSGANFLSAEKDKAWRANAAAAESGRKPVDWKSVAENDKEMDLKRIEERRAFEDELGTAEIKSSEVAGTDARWDAFGGELSRTARALTGKGKYGTAGPVQYVHPRQLPHQSQEAYNVAVRERMDRIIADEGMDGMRRRQYDVIFGHGKQGEAGYIPGWDLFRDLRTDSARLSALTDFHALAKDVDSAVGGWGLQPIVDVTGIDKQIYRSFAFLEQLDDTTWTTHQKDIWRNSFPAIADQLDAKWYKTGKTVYNQSRDTVMSAINNMHLEGRELKNVAVKTGSILGQLSVVTENIINQGAKASKELIDQRKALVAELAKVREPYLEGLGKKIQTTEAAIAARRAELMQLAPDDTAQMMVNAEIDRLEMLRMEDSKSYFEVATQGTRYSIGHTPLTVVQQLFDKAIDGRKIDYTGRNKGGAIWDSLFASIPNKKLGLETYKRVENGIMDWGNSREKVVEYYNKLREEVDQSRFRNVFGRSFSISAYMNVYHLPTWRLNQIAKEVGLKVPAGTTPAELFWKSAPGPIKVFSERVFSRSVDIPYNSTYVNLTRTLYPLVRFTLSPRFILMNLMEGDFFRTFLAGRNKLPALEKERLMARAAQGVNATWDAASKKWVYGEEGSGVLQNLHYDLEYLVNIANGPRSDVMVGAVLRTLENSPVMRDYIREMGIKTSKDLMTHVNKTITELEDAVSGMAANTKREVTLQEEITKLNRGLSLPKSAADEVSERALIQSKTRELDNLIANHRARMAAEQARVVDPRFQPAIDAAAHSYEQLIDHARQQFHGNPNRSAIERLGNSFLLYWPLSYQIKAAKAMTEFLFSRGFGFKTNLAPAMMYADAGRQIQKMRDEDPEVEAWFQNNRQAIFIVKGFFPTTPDELGVSLGPALRLPLQTLRGYKTPASAFERATQIGLAYDSSLGQEFIAEQSKKGGLLHDIFAKAFGEEE